MTAAELLQARPGSELVDVFVIYRDMRLEMPAEGQALDGSQRGEGFKHTGFVFSASARVPDSARQIKLPHMRQAFEFAELDWVHDSGREVDGGNVEVAGGQLGEIADRLA